MRTMYTLSIQLTKPPEKHDWGEFEVEKTFTVVSNVPNEPVFGYVVQKVEKVTNVTVHTLKGDIQYSTSQDIQKFTENQVNYATHTYYEVFPILNGITCYGKPDEERNNCIDDRFQNGALLRYEYDEVEKEYYADNEPPTSGTIQMIGTCVFIPTDETIAKRIYSSILNQSQSTIKIGNVQWSLSENTPANGLPYSEFYEFPKGVKQLIHRVGVMWNKEGKTIMKSEIKMVGGKRKKTYRRKKSRRN